MLTTLHLLRWQKALVTMKDRYFFNSIKNNIVIDEFTKTDASQYTVLLQSISIDVGIVDDITFGLVHHIKNLQSTPNEKNTKCTEQDDE
uniref:Uncharacterized protein n=1 Tax=Strongyloides papillosus TaxID=174720 RepID=A0A0N5BJZ5_STREA